MNTVMTTFLCLLLLIAGLDVAWSIRNLPQPKRIEIPALPTPPDKPVQFEDAYLRYVEKESHSKYAGRLPLEAERVERHLKIIREQLEVQRRIIEEARRP